MASQELVTVMGVSMASACERDINSWCRQLLATVSETCRNAGVFDGHGFNGRSAATYACKNITRWLGVDPNSVAKDPRRRLKALESVCGQIQRGLARQELCGFDASSSGLATCCALLQGDRLCVATIGRPSA